MSGATGSKSDDAAQVQLARVQKDLRVTDDLLDAEDLVRAQSTWANWPEMALEPLVGPPDRHLRHLDLGWLQRLEILTGAVNRLSAAVGGPADGPSGLTLLVERAEMLRYYGRGSWSAGTSCRLLRAADGWLAVNLPREDDLAAIPALLDCPPGADPWATVVDHIGGHRCADVVDRAGLLGLAIAAVPDAWTADAQRAARGEHDGPALCLIEPATRGRLHRSPVVVDLTSLWAGPLTGWYLARAGARVTKVESTRRSHGRLPGEQAFYNRLNSDKEVALLDLTTDSGVAALRDAVAGADIVIEASRPRVMSQFGIDPAEHIAAGGIWCSITGYGRSGPDSNRVAFGDDAAAAGGLVTFVDDEPWFIGDAAADPIAGLTATAGILALWAGGFSGLVDVAMRDAVAHLTDGRPVESRAV